MLTKFPVHATIPAQEIARAKQFYERLDFQAELETPGGVLFRSGETQFLVYPSRGAGTAQHTLMGWTVTDLESEIAELRGKGIVFEEYDMPGLKTVDAIFDAGPTRSAWFKDSEGNILGLVQFAPVPA